MDNVYIIHVSPRPTWTGYDRSVEHVQSLMVVPAQMLKRRDVGSQPFLDELGERGELLHAVGSFVVSPQVLLDDAFDQTWDVHEGVRAMEDG